MKALITAGGRGTRLRPITHTSNKHLIPIANKPMIHYALEAVLGAGIRDIGIVISPETGHEIRAALGDGSAWNARFTYVLQDAPRGLADCVKVAESFIGAEPFVFYLGDNVIVGGIRHFVEQFTRDGSNCHLVLARVKDPERFGVPEIADGRIVAVEEKPAHPKSPYAVTGIYLYDRHIFEAVKAIRPGRRAELEISDAHQYLLEANRLVLDRILEEDGGRIAGAVDAASDVAGKVIVQKGAKVVRSTIRGPAIIGVEAVVQDAYVGPFTAIGEGCEIRNSEVEYSIVLPRSRLLHVDVRIERSLLGREVTILRGEARPRTQKFIVGDQSVIELP